MYLTTWSDAASTVGGTFSEAVRCPFETISRCGADGGVSVEDPSGGSSGRLLVARILVRCKAPYCNWWRDVVEFCVVGDTLRGVPFEEVNEGGVSGDRYSQDWFVGCVASLVAF
jgi:hypothetical protein